MNEAKIQDYEVDLFRERWNPQVAEKDIEYFCKKWKVLNDSGFNDVRNFLRRHAKQ